jgi:hypothetical protein
MEFLMKTRGLTLVALLFLFTSCQEDEFYEKDYIDTVKDQYERANLPDDEAELAWDDPSNNPDMPDYVPPVVDDNSGSTNDDGSTPDGGSNPGDGSTPDGGSNPGGGSTPDGGSNPGGGSTPDGGSNPGGGSTPDGGGTDPFGGSTPGGGSNPGGGSTPDGGSNPGGVDVVIYTDQVDSFVQEAQGSKLDILWVIDNSGSMGDEQQDLGDKFDAFIQEFVEKGIDFKMAVTTTDTSRNRAGRVFQNSMERLTSANLQADKDRFLSDFSNLVKVGVRGSGYEKGLAASKAFTDRYQDNWLREDAYYAIVYMSDEEDQSSGEVESILADIAAKKQNAGLIKAYSIVDMVPTSRRGAISRGYERYNEMSELTNGSVASIKSDFHATLLEMGEEISRLTELFPLSNTPANADEIEVYVDGALNTDWTYDQSVNAIKFNTAPAAGSDISIEYQY